MVDRVVADVSDLWASTLQRRARVLLVVTVSGDGDASDGSGGRLRREPDNNVLPIVAVAESSGRGVLGHVPAVHDGVLAIVSTSTSVDLAGGCRAVAIGSTSRVETAADVCH